MQYENIIKELEAMRTHLHMGYEVHTDEMKRFIEDITYELRDWKQEVDDEMMDLRDEASSYEGLFGDCDQQINELRDELDWLKSLSVYQLSEWKQGHISYD